MSYCRQEGKDKIIFVTKEDHDTPSSAELIADDPNDPYEDHGLILPNGDINWGCPCLGGMASGPCGEQFKSAFSCFHYSQEEVKGSDCLDQFRAMQECMQKFPDLYPQEDEEEEEERSKDKKGEEQESSKDQQGGEEEEKKSSKDQQGGEEEEKKSSKDQQGGEEEKKSSKDKQATEPEAATAEAAEGKASS